MIGLGVAFLGFACTIGVEPVAPRIDGSEFRAWFEAARQGELDVPASVERRARGFRYVFIGGLSGGPMPGYFRQNAAELRARGVPKRAIHIIRPSSRRTVAENCAEVASAVQAIAEAGPEPLVLIGHSRGACDALAFALHDPDLVRDRVEALFLVQGPFGGTGLADYVLGAGPTPGRDVPPGHRLLARLIVNVEAALVARGPHAGLTDLTRSAARAYWTRTVREHAAAAEVIGSKIYYVEAATRPGRLRLLQRTMARYLAAHFGPNDGIVALGDQSLPGLGTSLGVLDAGHADLTRRFPATRAGRRDRKALILSILMAVGSPHSGDDRAGVTVSDGSRPGYDGGHRPR